MKSVSSTASRASQAGQIGVIILLIMVVLLTVGLSLAARSTQELFLAQQTTDSARVFNAAEAGVEQALSTNLQFDAENQTGTVTSYNDENVAVNYTITKVKALETRVFEGATIMVDVSTTTGSDLVVDWSHDDTCGTQDLASLAVSVYYDDAGTIRVRNSGLAACDRGDNFTLASSINVDGYRRRATVDLNPGDLFVRIKPVYNDTHLRVTGSGWELPVQYYNIRSEARSTVGNETRIVEVNRTLPTAPAVFDFALYSGTTIVK